MTILEGNGPCNLILESFDENGECIHMLNRTCETTVQALESIMCQANNSRTRCVDVQLNGCSFQVAFPGDFKYQPTPDVAKANHQRAIEFNGYNALARDFQRARAALS